MEVFVKDYVIFFVKEMCVIKLLEFVLVDVIWDIMECIVINFVVIVIYRVVMIELVIVQDNVIWVFMVYNVIFCV